MCICVCVNIYIYIYICIYIYIYIYIYICLRGEAANDPLWACPCEVHPNHSNKRGCRCISLSSHMHRRPPPSPPVHWGSGGLHFLCPSG